MSGTPEQKPSPVERSQMDLNTAIEELKDAFERQPASGETASKQGRRAGILDIPVELQIVIGSLDMTVAEMFELKENSVINLNRGVGEPVDIMANGRCIARGEIVAMEGDNPKLGIRITDVPSG